MLLMQRQWIASDSCIHTILVLVSSVVGFNVQIYFSGERRQTGEVVIDIKDPSCVRLADSSSTGICC